MLWTVYNLFHVPWRVASYSESANSNNNKKNTHTHTHNIIASEEIFFPSTVLFECDFCSLLTVKFVFTVFYNVEIWTVDSFLIQLWSMVTFSLFNCDSVWGISCVCVYTGWFLFLAGAISVTLYFFNVKIFRFYLYLFILIFFYLSVYNFFNGSFRFIFWCGEGFFDLFKVFFLSFCLGHFTSFLAVLKQIL